MGRVAAALVLVSLVIAGVAHADADQASDTLYVGRVFLPELALIAAPIDLGGVPTLFGKPATYARFLANELQFVYPGKVMIVLPQGAALGDHARLVANPAVLKAEVEPGPDGLAITAIALVRKLAGVGRPPDTGVGVSVWVWVAAGAAAIALVGAGVALARRGRAA
jgi:hypothetical protein